MAICKHCQKEYAKRNSLQKACSIECAIALTNSKRDKNAAREARLQELEWRKKREELKPLSHFRGKAQAAFNAYIRERDKLDGCISCGRLPGGYTVPQWHAGHYFTRKARPDIAFHEDNCHKQCAQCNHFMSGNIEQYRINLIKKIGADRFVKLQEVVEIKPTREYYQAIEKEYKAKLKELKREKD